MAALAACGAVYMETHCAPFWRDAARILREAGGGGCNYPACAAEQCANVPAFFADKADLGRF
ncbi:hypothetical protein KBAD11_14930 [Aeromonas dhakensis]|nr:hypothetical protein KBAD45_14930 [Aeromonas dhakensis]CAD7499159.1 hypothetical protein KBAD59_14960 [Aeromonas dhakensis]CAD7499607.1 hypothetical protein KBAD11_14930 [Aeromonas dhakensis]CAD7512352.1 hypothetical protein KBAD14_KBAD14_14940 [Aeromonas dhakensis]CAD7512430.1 hypothetical protein KBAD10_14950 [Aeromonas dhakensis]